MTQVQKPLNKGPFFVQFNTAQKTITTQARASTILPSHVGMTFNVHNGQKYIPVFVTEEMVNRKLGEFSQTRAKYTYKKK